MSSMTMMCSTANRSSLEIMLDTIQQREEQGLKNVPPALPVRPVSKARLPRARKELPINFQKGGLNPNDKEDEAKKQENLKSSFELGVFSSERIEREALVESPRKQISAESDYIAASKLMSITPPAFTGECVCSEDGGFVLNKIGVGKDTRERELQGTLEIQKYFRGHQARCYYRKFKRGICTLQSFVRGENARKDYEVLIKRLTAIVVLQKHMKRRIAWRTLQKRQRAVLCLQAAIRGWLNRRHLRSTENSKKPMIKITKGTEKPDQKNSQTKDHVQLQSSILVDLQRRMLRADAALEEKEEENAALQQQLQQFEQKWAQYEAKMKSMEEMWQDQLTSLQFSFAAAKYSLAAEETKGQPGGVAASPKYHHHNACNVMCTGTRTQDGSSQVKFSDTSHDVGPQQMNGKLNAISHLGQHKMVFDDDASFLHEGKSGVSSSRMNPDIELQKLKLRFGTWTKDYKIRLLETKAMLQKLGHSEMEKSHRRWWRK
ncbi:hypothetical protein F0562_014043 [Nyssa sinensis]|uniref:Myosin motor domain-containing protein n=1 Tax=Nyssa sinensis TaxID=561372 RepID=A0A5J4ZRT0_9ASTE|nr:hypothetical protein F0562_014043 [Nyssa sinensis]